MKVRRYSKSMAGKGRLRPTGKRRRHQHELAIADTRGCRPLPATQDSLSPASHSAVTSLQSLLGGLSYYSKQSETTQRLHRRVLHPPRACIARQVQDRVRRAHARQRSHRAPDAGVQRTSPPTGYRRTSRAPKSVRLIDCAKLRPHAPLRPTRTRHRHCIRVQGHRTYTTAD